MRMPKKMGAYCPFCKCHQEHEVEKVKKGKASTRHRIDRQKRRSFGIGNRGKFSKRPGSEKTAPASTCATGALNVRKPISGRYHGAPQIFRGSAGRSHPRSEAHLSFGRAHIIPG